MAKSPNWTEKELEILKENYPKLGKCKQLEDLFVDRSLTAICLKASREGLKVINNIREKRTNAEYENLLNNTNFISLEIYKGSTIPILHLCKICESEWITRPQHALRPGANCPKCSLDNRLNDVVEVDKVLKEGNFHQLTEYTGSLDAILLKHNTCGYIWTTKYSYIQQGSGCPLCNKGFGSYSYSKNTDIEKATIYLLKITSNSETFLKVGVTLRNLSKRVSELKSRIGPNTCIEILYERQGLGKNILNLENNILKTFTKYKSMTKFDGCTELLDFNKNKVLDIITYINGHINGN